MKDISSWIFEDANKPLQVILATLHILITHEIVDMIKLLENYDEIQSSPELYFQNKNPIIKKHKPCASDISSGTSCASSVLGNTSRGFLHEGLHEEELII